MIKFVCGNCHKEVTNLDMLSRPQLKIKIPVADKLGKFTRIYLYTYVTKESICKECVENITGKPLNRFKLTEICRNIIQFKELNITKKEI